MKAKVEIKNHPDLDRDREYYGQGELGYVLGSSGGSLAFPRLIIGLINSGDVVEVDIGRLIFLGFDDDE